MFNFNKRQSASEWPQQAEQAVNAMAAEVKSTADELLDSVHHKTEQAQDTASRLIHKLKHSVDALSESGTAQAEAIGSQAAEIKQVLQQDVSAGWQALKQNSKATVEKHPLASVVVAAGAGLLIGYLLTKHSDK